MHGNEIPAKKVLFSAHCCFAYDNGIEDRRCFELLAKFLRSKSAGLALYGHGKLWDYLIQFDPKVSSCIKYIIQDELTPGPAPAGIPTVSPKDLPESVQTVFLCETLAYPRMRMKRRLAEKKVEVISPDILSELDYKAIPLRAWIPYTDNIYGEDFILPEINFLSGQDMVLIDCPSRNLSLMPNGLAYVHNALKKAGIRFQTVDLDIIVYHRYHLHRLMDTPGKVFTPGGKEMQEDPWMAEKMGFWNDPDVIEYFRKDITEIVAKLVEAHPKVIGLSIQQCNTRFSEEVVKKVKEKLPDTIILTGGYSCYLPHIGLKAFPLSDYMIIGEADFIVGDLVKKILSGDRPRNLPGVMSRFDDPGERFVPGIMPHDLDSLEIPKYDWIDLNCYRNYSHYKLTPITGSRGCHWGRCRFCGEARFWRGRNPKKVVDELEWLYDRGCDLFVFNESDVNGDPEQLKEVCREVIRRNLKVRLSGQLRVDRRNTREFLDLLKQAGFISLRFGVDGWSDHVLQLENKGYTMKMVAQNLKDSWDAGLPIEVNSVIGVPGETDDDITETIDQLLRNNKYIWRLANINQLVLLPGSIYWREPEKHHICFRGNKEEIYAKHLFHIPAELWYSTDPYIDGNVRLERCKRILRELKQHGFNFGPGAEPKVEDYLEKKDTPGTSVNPVSRRCEVIRDMGGFYVVDSANAKRALRSTSCKGTLFIQEVWNKIASLAGDHEKCRAFLSRKKQRLHFIYQERGFKGTLVFVLQKLREKYTRHTDLLAMAEPAPLTSMIRENFRGYNLIKVRSDYYAIKHGFYFDIHKFENGGHAPGAFLKARSIRELEALVEHYSKVPSAALRMAKENYMGYNIIQAGDEFYGVKHGHFFSLNKFNEGAYANGVIFKSSAVHDVEAAIDKHLCAGAVQVMVKENFNGYNIIRFGNVIYAVKHGYHFNPAGADRDKQGRVIYFKSGSLENVEKLVLAHVAEQTGLSQKT